MVLFKQSSLILDRDQSASSLDQRVWELCRLGDHIQYPVAVTVAGLVYMYGNAGWNFLSFFFRVYPLYFHLSYFPVFVFLLTATREIVFDPERSLLTYRN